MNNLFININNNFCYQYSIIMFRCIVCNLEITTHDVAKILCMNCNITQIWHYHPECLINTDKTNCQCAICVYCTHDKSKMQVFNVSKLFFVIRHYVKTREQYLEIINSFTYRESDDDKYSEIINSFTYRESDDDKYSEKNIVLARYYSNKYFIKIYDKFIDICTSTEYLCESLFVKLELLYQRHISVIYKILLSKFTLTDKNIEELVKEEFYRIRSGNFTKGINFENTKN